MAELIAKSNVAVLIGMGVTGRSAARYLTREGRTFVWLDTRELPPTLAEIEVEFPSVARELGELKESTLLAASEIIVSPGVAIAHPAIRAAAAAGIPVLGDIELFMREISAPVIAITGSNAKSTVTTLVGEMAKACGKRALVGGNIGVPVLDLLLEPQAELYVLELSSFQLETIARLGAEVATVLNVSEDHMDRYDSLAHYHQAKQRVYFGARAVVINRQDPLTAPPLAEGVQLFSFGLNAPDRHGFGLRTVNGIEMLAYEFIDLMPASDVRLPGRHNLANALASLALGKAAGLSMEPMLETLRHFAGLPHRCEWVAGQDGITWYNDSKGTNVGATLAALQGLASEQGRIVLIAGGVGKGADFAPLAQAAAQLRALVLIGEDADKIAAVFEGITPIEHADSMMTAVQQAAQLAQPGDCVLLSPACASFDMFSGYDDRGRQFVAAVKEVLG
ncbi:UDP-N-acetylmuramoyl-L-alanine--D-glutamate ligase [Pseudomaricurvus sp. HS19]|uniref:UDP-N-acetylmuramoyl-L-alanine--D-glutamate ligase n=1 Tax=Pseudomaricurvus sp. HS19 TaxID=2692626 RepID=UPI00351A2F80